MNSICRRYNTNRQPSNIIFDSSPFWTFCAICYKFSKRFSATPTSKIFEKKNTVNNSIVDFQLLVQRHASSSDLLHLSVTVWASMQCKPFFIGFMETEKKSMSRALKWSPRLNLYLSFSEVGGFVIWSWYTPDIIHCLDKTRGVYVVNLIIASVGSDLFSRFCSEDSLNVSKLCF